MVQAGRFNIGVIKAIGCVWFIKDDDPSEEQSRCASMMSTMFPARAHSLSYAAASFWMSWLVFRVRMHDLWETLSLSVERTNERTKERTNAKKRRNVCVRTKRREQNRVSKRGRARNEKEGHKGLTGEVTGERSLISMAVFSQRAVSFTG